jgi:anti-sigma regulatory factor (Ser/Thr protein kinase)
MMDNIVRLHVPSKMSYTSLVEDFMRALGAHIFPSDQVKRDNLSTVMNEIFTNVVKHSNTAKVDGIVRFQLEVGKKELKVSIYDHGPGIKINDQYPPYPLKFVGQKFKFRRVLDGAVFLNVDSSHVLSFSFEQSTSKHELSENLKNLKGHGMGISIITKIMDSVTYTLKDDGQFDWQMIKKLD